MVLFAGHYIVSLPNESKNMEQKVLLQNKL